MTTPLTEAAIWAWVVVVLAVTAEAGMQGTEVYRGVPWFRGGDHGYRSC
jgi:hypothetical protein